MKFPLFLLLFLFPLLLKSQEGLRDQVDTVKTIVLYVDYDFTTRLNTVNKILKRTAKSTLISYYTYLNPGNKLFWLEPHRILQEWEIPVRFQKKR